MSASVLISPTELAASLATEAVVLADVRWNLGGPPGQPEYAAGHLPGAQWVDLETELSSAPGEGGRHPLPSAETFTAAMRRIGLDDGGAIVVYDGATSLAAARLWWLLTDAGHHCVRVLDGGYAAWLAAGLPVETGPGQPVAPGSFTARPGGRARVDGAAIAADLSGGRRLTLVDVRAAERYSGATEPIDPIAGHIPGAVNRPTTANLTADGRFRPPGDIAAAYAGLSEPVLYCGSGITAAHALLALEAAGRDDGRIYPGSWSDWIRDPNHPVATGRE